MIAAAILLARLENAGLTVRVTNDGRLGVTGARTPELDAEIAATKEGLRWTLTERTRRGVCLVSASHEGEVALVSEHLRATDGLIGVALDMPTKTLLVAFERFVVECQLPDPRNYSKTEHSFLDALSQSKLLVHHAERTLVPLAREYGIRFSEVVDTYVAACLLEHELLGLPPLTMSDISFRELRFSAPPLSPGTAIYLRHLHTVWAHLDKKLTKAGLREVAQIEFAAVPAAVDMQRVGARIDQDARSRTITASREALATLRDPLEREIGHNLYSREAAAALAHAGIPVASVNAESVAPYADMELAQKLLALTVASKRSSAIGMNIGLARISGSRAHPHTRQLSTPAGTFSTWFPDLHCLAKSPTARSCIVAEEGHLLVSAGYVDAGLRILAAHLGDRDLLEVFSSDGCPHVRAASLILNKLDADITDDERRLGRLAHEFAFGKTPEQVVVDAFDRNVHLTLAAASDLRAHYLECYPGIRDWLGDALHGRRLDVPGSMHRVDRFVEMATDPHVRIVAPFDATLMNATKWALGDLSQLLQTRGAKPVFCGLGELLVEVPHEHAEAVRAQVELVLTSVLFGLADGVPIRVATTIARSWTDAVAAMTEICAGDSGEAEPGRAP